MADLDLTAAIEAAAERAGEFQPHQYREHEMSDGEDAIILGDAAEIAEALVRAAAPLIEAAVRVVAVQIEREDLQAIFDLAVGSMDFGSGFWETKDALAARRVAELLGLDPMEATPASMSKHFRHPFEEPQLTCSGPCCAELAQVYAHGCHHCSDPADALQHTAPPPIGYLGKVLDG